MGVTMTNIGPKVSFIDPDQADPQPTNLTFGLAYKAFENEQNSFTLVYDVDKLLVSSYPDMDWDGDGAIGGYDKNGNESIKNNTIFIVGNEKSGLEKSIIKLCSKVLYIPTFGKNKSMNVSHALTVALSQWIKQNYY